MADFAFHCADREICLKRLRYGQARSDPEDPHPTVEPGGDEFLSPVSRPGVDQTKEQARAQVEAEPTEVAEAVAHREAELSSEQRREVIFLRT